MRKFILSSKRPDHNRLQDQDHNEEISARQELLQSRQTSSYRKEESSKLIFLALHFLHCKEPNKKNNSGTENITRTCRNCIPNRYDIQNSRYNQFQVTLQIIPIRVRSMYTKQLAVLSTIYQNQGSRSCGIAIAPIAESIPQSNYLLYTP